MTTIGALSLLIIAISCVWVRAEAEYTRHQNRRARAAATRAQRAQLTETATEIRRLIEDEHTTVQDLVHQHAQGQGLLGLLAGAHHNHDEDELRRCLWRQANDLEAAAQKLEPRPRRWRIR